MDPDGPDEAPKYDPLPDRLTRLIRRAPGVRACRGGGLGGRDRDLRDDDGEAVSLLELEEGTLEAIESERNLAVAAASDAKGGSPSVSFSSSEC